MQEPIERRKVYELVAERLLAEIADRRLKPGDQLPPERTLAERYGVGRSSVREALRILESKGLIRSAGHGNFRVAEYGNPLNQSISLLLSLQDGDLPELYEVRKIMEVEAAGLAAGRRTKEDLDRMRGAVTEMVESVASRERYIGADVEFHLAVARATGNRIAWHMMDAVRDAMRRALASVFAIPGSPERSTEEHERILAAIERGSAEDARREMRDHLVRVEAEALERLGVQEGGPGRSVPLEEAGG